MFTQSQKNSKDHEKKGHETVLLDKQNKRKYQGNTNFKKVRFNKRQIKTDCNVCGKKGHKGVDCWENPKNAHKRPKNWKSKAEKSNSALIADTKTATKKDLFCTYCKKTNHKVENCFQKQRHEKANESNAEIAFIHTMEETSLLLLDKSTIGKYTFIADTGATCHMCNISEGMINMVPFETDIKVGNAATMRSKYKGDYQGIATQED
mgnify:CR=1 FL=1